MNTDIHVGVYIRMNKHSMDMNKRHSHNYVCIFLQVFEQVSMHIQWNLA